MLKGVSHVHSTYSFDGKVEIQQLHSFFEARGFNFVLMSEHIEELGLEQMQRFFDDCLRVSTPQCALIPGIEIDALHILIFGITRPEFMSGLLSFTEDCHSKEALIILSHPLKIQRGIPDAVAPMLSGVEIWNSRYDSRQTPRFASLGLLDRLQKARPGLLPMCGMDFHSYSDFANIWLELETADRSPCGIMDALRAGRFRICSAGNSIPIYSDSSAFAKALYRVESLAATTLHDGATAVYKRLKRGGLRFPGPLRRAVKRLI